MCALLTSRCEEWNNSKKPYEKFDKCNACENSVDMHSPRRMSRKREYCRLMIRRGSEGDMVKWQVGGSSGLLRKVQRVSVCCSMALEFREMWYIHWSYGTGGEWTDSFSCAHFWCAWETSQACVYCDAISEEKWTGAGQSSYDSTHHRFCHCSSTAETSLFRLDIETLFHLPSAPFASSDRPNQEKSSQILGAFKKKETLEFSKRYVRTLSPPHVQHSQFPQFSNT